MIELASHKVYHHMVRLELTSHKVYHHLVRQELTSHKVYQHVSRPELTSYSTRVYQHVVRPELTSNKVYKHVVTLELTSKRFITMCLGRKRRRLRCMKMCLCCNWHKTRFIIMELETMHILMPRFFYFFSGKETYFGAVGVGGGAGGGVVARVGGVGDLGHQKEGGALHFSPQL